MNNFNPFSPKLIYVFRINDAAHKGCLKIGETTCSETDFSKLSPNSSSLNTAARKRIDQYTRTAGIVYELLHTEVSFYMRDGGWGTFNDKEVHNILLRSGVKRKVFDSSHKANEWFITDLGTVKAAIRAAKEGRTSLLLGEMSNIEEEAIHLRPEQREAIDKTKKRFKKQDSMLWNAKMRFGKTICALQLVKEMEVSKTIILTHRPVVDKGWYDDYKKIFADRSDFVYGSRSNGEKFDSLMLDASKGKKVIWFASLQDLRGSEQVGGKFDKNAEVFSPRWDLIIVDEAHEGTQTELGQAVIKELHKEGTKLLSLTGTAFNLLDHFDEAGIYTWDYIMEQRAKLEWDKLHPGDPNPYACLPQMNIWTYDLGNLIKNFLDEDVAFNFREFFRTDAGGDFVHPADVKALLDLMTTDDADSLYPFANAAYRNLFRHTLWVVPGVKAASALCRMLREHPVFQFFKVVNVAGEGDGERDDALKLVRAAIGKEAEKTLTITVTCGRLTTGVSVPEWSAVFMLSGSYSTSASSYMQTIFRVQTPATIGRLTKTDCYVFDFAPDRTLRVLAETAKVSTQAGKTGPDDRKQMGEFLNYCPVIGIQGSRMAKYDTGALLEQLKKVYVERVVRNGFEDTKLYNDELLKLDDLELQAFEGLKKIIGTTKAMAKTGDIDINRQGLTNEEHEELERLKKKKKGERTPEELARLEELKQKRKNRDAAISILRGISIRMPLLIYGAEINDAEEEITIDNFADLIDPQSWEEFMPRGVTKELFNRFKRYYDPDIFTAAGKRIRALAKAADKMDVEERIERITEIFSTFRNPDKETVLTPWRVVNMHMGDTLGGWCFYDASYDTPLREPRYVEHEGVTQGVFNADSRVLEINSKTGLYPLYVAYSIYRSRVADSTSAVSTLEEQLRLWDETLAENVFVVCKTPMAKSITRRTLAGFRGSRVNARYFEDLINQIKNKPRNFIDKMGKGKTYWKANQDDNMKFNAIVGNPPYQVTTAKKETDNGQKRSQSIFHYFQLVSEQLGRYTSLIYPGKRWIHRSGKGMEDFGLKQINDPHLALLKFFPNSQDVFKDVGIADGISIVLKDMQKQSAGFTYVYSAGGREVLLQAENPGESLFTLNPFDALIASRLEQAITKYACLHDSVLPQKLFGIESDFVEKNPTLVRPYKEGEGFDPDTQIKLFTNDQAGSRGRSRWFIVSRSVIQSGLDQLCRWKVIVSSANAGGQKRSNQIEVVDDHSAFGRSRVALKTFATEQEARNFFRYATTDIIRFALLLTDENLTSLAKKVPDLPSYADDNGLVDYSGDVNAQACALFDIDKESQAYIRKVISAKDGEKPSK